MLRTKRHQNCLANQSGSRSTDSTSIMAGRWWLAVSLPSRARRSTGAERAGAPPELDKMLWVVLRKSQRVWHVQHINICASEPPYWYPEQYGGLVWPCGVYAGLDDGNEETLESRCRARATLNR